MATWNPATSSFIASAVYSDTEALVTVETEDENAYAGIEEAAVHKHVAHKLIKLPSETTDVKIYVKAQDGTVAMVAGKDYYPLRIRKKIGRAHV